MRITNPIRNWIKSVVIEAMDDRQREANMRYIDCEIRSIQELSEAFDLHREDRP